MDRGQTQVAGGMTVVEQEAGVGSSLDADACWEAVVRRDADATHFVIGVLTTGIYCRSGCKARLPLRRNVLFFRSAEAAERAGFRACKRCRPASRGVPDWLVPCARAIEQDPARSISSIAKEAGVSRSSLHRGFQQVLGLSPASYRDAVRAGALRDALASATRITDALLDAGFGSASAAYSASADALGLAPGDLKRGGEGATIRYATGTTELGRMIAAATDRGLCLLEFLPDRAVRRAVTSRFPNAQIRAARSDEAEGLRRIIASVDEPRTDLGIPLDVLGTAFQRRVWAALRQVGWGERLSYAELARRVGAPRAQRAVATACANNPVAGVGSVSPSDRQ